MGLLHMPLPIAFNISPYIPNLFLRRLAGALQSPPQVFIPWVASLSDIREPIPHSSFTGRSLSTSSTVLGLIHLSPSGFEISLASFALSMLGPIPTVQFIPNLFLIAPLMDIPITSGPPTRWWG